MSFKDLIEEDETRVRELFCRVRTLFEETSKHRAENWHNEKFDIYGIAAVMSNLSDEGLLYCSDDRKIGFQYLFIDFNSLDELELKLTMRGY